MTTWGDGPGVVELPDGRRLRGRGLRHPLPAGDVPDFGVYLLGRDPGPFDWDHRWVRWPDFRTPSSTEDAMAALREAYERSATERVEIACGGGKGRTGTALAAIAVLAGIPPAEAVAWVRRHYDPHAVETPWQRAVGAHARRMSGAGPSAWHHLRPRLMTRTVILRPWQKAALERLAASTSPDFLAVATPGAGKTTFALTAARQAMAADPKLRLLVVVPTAHLKLQWAHAASAFDLHLDWRWSPAEGALPGDMHGVVTTYQQVATAGRVLRGLAHAALVIFDELHHAAEERAWGDALSEAFEVAPRRLALSGTPFRSDTHAIPFVRYHLDEAVPDYEYNYGDALADGGVVRPVYFPRVDGMMEWSAPDGSLHAHSFDDPLDAARAGQRLRTAYSVDGEWLPHVLRQAHDRLLEIRRRQPDAGGLVIATDQEHAKGIARLLTDRLKVRAVVATSDDPDASALISRFATSTDPWIVAVRMVAEGVDIPRLRVGVFATTTTTELFFRQAVGRLVRWTRGSSRQHSFLYIPDEPRLRARAFAIAEQRRHSLRHDDRDLLPREPAEEAVDAEQFSLFAPISAVPLDGAGGPDWAYDGDGAPEPAEDATLIIPLPPLALAGRPVDGRTRREHKAHLRKANADKGRLIAHHTGLTHAGVNAELNRVSGVQKVSEATVEQLQRRLEKAEAWLTQASARRVPG